MILTAIKISESFPIFWTSIDENTIEIEEKNNGENSETIDRLVGNENRYEVPAAFSGRVQSNWDAFVQACSAPITYIVPSLASRM